LRVLGSGFEVLGSEFRIHATFGAQDPRARLH
jgi:hypothetical protein